MSKEGEMYTAALDAMLKLLKSPDVKAADIQAARQFMSTFGIEGSAETQEQENNLCEVLELPEFAEDLLDGTND